MKIDDVDFVSYQVESARLFERQAELTVVNEDGHRLRIEFTGVCAVGWKGSYRTGDWHLVTERREIREAIDFRNRHDRDFEEGEIMELILWTEENLEFFNVIFERCQIHHHGDLN